MIRDRPASRPRFFTRQGALWDNLNRVIDAVRRSDIAPVTAEAPFNPRPQLQILQARIVVIAIDWVECNVYQFIEGGASWTGPSQFVVGLPWLLRQTPFDGQTYNGVTYNYTGIHVREATAAAVTETQRITPDYVLGDVIYVARYIRGGTGISQNLESIDLNLDGRCWAAEQPAP